MKNNLKRFSESLKDLLIEPMRSLLIPKFDELKQSALDAGALTFGISGSGPSVFAICEGEQKANQILKALEEAYKDTGISIKKYCNKISENSGARIIENNAL
jgi:homoserine kinase